MKRTRSETAKEPSSRAFLVRVGGAEFRTSRETLEQGGRGYFAACLQHEEMKEIDFGRGELLPFIEVDRDPDVFRVVLAWMRTHRLPSAVVSDKQMLEDLVPEASFFALDELSTAVETALVLLRRSTEPLRAFSVTTGTVMIMQPGGSRGEEIMETVELAPHEYCLVSFVTATTYSFTRPRKHHKVLCFVEERDQGAVEGADKWKPVVPEAIFPRATTPKKAFEDYQASRVVLASFVYKHWDNSNDSEDESKVTDILCAPQYSQRVNMILGPRGVHNPASFPAKPDSGHESDSPGALGPDLGPRTRLVFRDDKYEMNSGASWTIFGVIGPAAKVLEYARGLA
jgi:hypothetical protein